MPFYDYAKLLGRIKEQGHTQKSVSAAVGMHPSTLSQKLHGRSPFTQREIARLCSLLGIQDSAIGKYFFAHKV